MKNSVLLAIIISIFGIFFGIEWLANNLDQKYEKYYLSNDNNR